MDAALKPDVRRQRGQAPASYNLGNFLRTLATPEPIKDWSLMSLKEKLIKVGARVVSHGRRGRLATANVPGDFAAHRRIAVAAATGASLRRTMIICSGATDRSSALVGQGK